MIKLKAELVQEVGGLTRASVVVGCECQPYFIGISSLGSSVINTSYEKQPFHPFVHQAHQFGEA